MSEGREDLPGISEETILEEEQDNGWEGGEEEVQEEITPGKDETTLEIVKRSYDTLKRQSAGTPKEGNQAQGPPQGAKGSGREVLIPPQRLTVEQKELFGQMAPPLQKAVHDMFRHHEGLLTRNTQDLKKAEQEASHIIEVVRPYLRSHPELTEQGLTEAKLVAGLLAAHERLSNPKTAIDAWLEVGSQIGVDSKRARAAIGYDGGGDPNDISHHPQFQALQQELARVSSTVNQSQSAQQQYAMQQREGVISQVRSEMEALREERDASGRYLYPKLHDDAFLLDTKPLVATLAKRFPQLGYGELLRRAHDILVQQEDGQAQPGFQGSPRLPQTQKYVPPQAAGVSVRGRSAPLVPGDADDIPAEALTSVRAATEWALKQSRSGR